MADAKLSEGAERLWRLLAHYGTKTPLTAPGCRAADGWLAEELGVTERTVRRYRAALAAAGILREQLNERNAVEFRLYRQPEPSSPPRRIGATPPILPPEIHTLETLLMTLVRERVAVPGIEPSELNTLYDLLNSRLDTRPTPSHTLSHAGNNLSRQRTGDGTWESVSHQEEDNSSFTPLIISTTTPTPPSDNSATDSAPPAEAEVPGDSPPRHVLRTIVEAYGVFPDSAYAIANKLAQAGYTESETAQLLKHLWQETRGQVGLLVYRLTKRALPPRHALEQNTRRKPTYQNERDAATKKMFREMLE